MNDECVAWTDLISDEWTMFWDVNTVDSAVMMNSVQMQISMKGSDSDVGFLHIFQYCMKVKDYLLENSTFVYSNILHAVGFNRENAIAQDNGQNPRKCVWRQRNKSKRAERDHF